MLEEHSQGITDPIEALTVEAAAILVAGSHTIARVMCALTYYILSDRSILAKLTAELETVVEDPLHLPPWSTLEQLPYLTGVIQEGLRLTYGAVTRLSRIAPDEALHYEGTLDDGQSAQTVRHTIPPGAAVCILHDLVHHNESIFPDSYQFIPERWIDSKGQRRTDLDRYLMSFGKGGRQCIGML